ncbi:MAG: energy transducer TonB [Acidobacteria bacterium]|nr:energy transducer TonB [Acidobacteriota bacterium]
MASPVRILVTLALLVAIAIPVGGQSQNAAAAPPSVADRADIQAAISHLELARQHYANNRLADAEQELSDTIDRVRAARAAEGTQPAAGAREQLPRAGRDVPFPAIVKRSQPTYPLEAAQQGIRGVVIIDAVIDRTGKVRNARIARSIPALDRVSLDAVRQWRFAPSTLNGAPAEVAATLVLPFTFRRAPLPTDDLDLARFYADRGELVSAEIALVRARAAITQEAACFTDALPMGWAPMGANLGRIEPPRKIKHVNPTYPPLAQKARVTGTVVMEAVIAVDGRVRCLRVLRSVPLLDQAAIDSVAQWEFTPALVAGTPAAVRLTTTVNFSLQ